MANKKYDGRKLSKAMAEKVAAVKSDPNKVPYFGITFDLHTEYSLSVGAWDKIKRQAKKYGFSHPQGSTYIMEASPATEEDAVDIMMRFLTVISKKDWAADSIRNFQVIQYRGSYDVLAVFKEDAPINIEKVSMHSGFKLRKAFAGAYEKCVEKAVAEGTINEEAIIHDNGSHFGIVFDIHNEDDCALLRQLFGENCETAIYAKIGRLMKRNGFEWVQGSTYVCANTTADSVEGKQLINSVLTELYFEPHFKEVVRDIKVVEFYRKYDVTFLMKEQKIGSFKKILKSIPTK